MNDTERAIKQFKEWEKDRWRLGKSPSIPTLILARQALEKQMPKKIKKFTYPKNIVYMYCPECDEGIDENNLFCSRCGQKLDWEVESEQRLDR